MKSSDARTQRLNVGIFKEGRAEKKRGCKSAHRERSGFAVSIGVLNNMAAVYAENSLNNAYGGLQTVLQELSSGSRINSASDDPAGISMVDGMEATIASLRQSVVNATEGQGKLQVAEGALSQVTSMLERAVTLATEASNGTLNNAQDMAANDEYQSILAEITNIGRTTTYNQEQVFGGGIAGLGATTSVFMSDSTTTGVSIDALYFDGLSASHVGDAGGAVQQSGNGVIQYTQAANGDQSTNLAATDLLNSTDARNALTAINQAIGNVAAQEGYFGSQDNTAGSQIAILNTEIVNQTAALNAIQAVDYGAATTNLSKYEILIQTGISALAQANEVAREVLKLLPQ
jgi:flagellin